MKMTRKGWRIRFDAIRFGWLAGGRWPLKFWQAFRIRREFTDCGPMTTIALGPFLIWLYWHYELR